MLFVSFRWKGRSVRSRTGLVHCPHRVSSARAQPYGVFAGWSVLSPHLHPLSFLRPSTDPLRLVVPFFFRPRPPPHRRILLPLLYKVTTLLSTLHFHNACFHSGSCFCSHFHPSPSSFPSFPPCPPFSLCCWSLNSRPYAHYLQLLFFFTITKYPRLGN